jgi:signal transduction histidine kinase/ligand-binding sensor domain-containing protein
LIITPSYLKKYLLVALSLFTALYSNSQTIIPRFEFLGVNQGLPHSSIYSILQDKKGFMWFGTADGLCRYDGSELKTFKYLPINQGDQVNNFVKGKMVEDNKGNIWFSNRNGIYKWDFLKEVVSREMMFPLEDYKNTDFQAVFIKDGETLWLANPVFGIFEYNTSLGKLLEYPLPNNIEYPAFGVKYFSAEAKENIYFRIGTVQDPYLRFDLSERKYHKEFGQNPPHALFLDDFYTIKEYSDKLVYLQKADSSSKVIPKKIEGKPIAFYSFDGIRDKYNRLWMTASGNGLYSLDETSGKFQQFRHDNSNVNSLPFDLTTCLFIDRNENLWIGTDGAGVARLDLKEPRFNLFPLSEGDYPFLKDYFTKCLYEDEDNRIWFGTQTNGLNIFDPETKKLISYLHKEGDQSSIPGNIVGAIAKDREGKMWIGSSGGISIFDETHQTFRTIPIIDGPQLYPKVNNLVFKILHLNNGDCLAATGIGIIKISKDGEGSHVGQYFKNTKHLISSTTDLVELSNGSIYATIPGLGLYHFEPELGSYRLVDAFLEGNDLRSISIDLHEQHKLWIGSGKGLIIFNTLDHTFKVWDIKDGIGNDYIYGVLQDSIGNLWFSTNKGLSYMDRKKDTFKNYTFLDGLQSNEFNTGSFYKSQRGRFFFGGIKGFNWFEKMPATDQLVAPTAAITSIEINDKVFLKNDGFLNKPEIKVNHDQNDFQFQFAALDYTRPEANQFKYILEGWDTDWITSENKSVRYSNLSPGRYTLRLVAFNSYGIGSMEERVMILVSPPFWKRTYFFALLVIVMVAFVAWITYQVSQSKARKKFSALEKQIAVDAERNRISSDMHDEIGSGITHIALLSELMLIKTNPKNELKKDIQTISNSARALVNTISEIIWALNPHNDSLGSLLAYIREQSQNYFESMPVRFKVLFPESVPDIKLSNEERRNLYLVTREALNNALKHSKATEIYLEMKVIEGGFCFSVYDNGKGMDGNTKKPGKNGLSIMKDRMETIGGTIVWESTNLGTKVKFCHLIKA